MSDLHALTAASAAVAVLAALAALLPGSRGSGVGAGVRALGVGAAALTGNLVVLGVAWLTAAWLGAPGFGAGEARRWAAGVTGDALALAALAAAAAQAGATTLPWAPGFDDGGLDEWALTVLVTGVVLRAATAGGRDPAVLALGLGVLLLAGAGRPHADAPWLVAAAGLAPLAAAAGRLPLALGLLAVSVGGLTPGESAAAGDHLLLAAAVLVVAGPHARAARGPGFDAPLALVAAVPGCLGLAQVQPAGAAPGVLVLAVASVALLAVLSVSAARQLGVRARGPGRRRRAGRVAGVVELGAALVLASALLVPEVWSFVLDDEGGLAGQTVGPALTDVVERARWGLGGAAAFTVAGVGASLAVERRRAGPVVGGGGRNLRFRRG